MARTKVSIEKAEASRAENLAYTRRELRNVPAGKGPFAAIRRKCLDCTVWQGGLVASCEMTDCALWPYRFGGDPFRKGGAAVPENETDA